MSPRATIYDVAERAGVSKSLVSLVLQGSPKVSDRRREAVERAMTELDYRPSRAAAALAGHRSRTVGVLIDDFRNPWFVDLLDGLREVLDPLGVATTVTDLASDARGGGMSVETFLAARADAIVVACEPTPEIAQALAGPGASGVPVLIAGNRAATLPGARVIASDDAAGARLVADHLRELGHTRIGHVTGAGGSSRLRRDSFTSALVAAGLPPVAVHGDAATNEPDGFAATRSLLAERPDTTAIFAANDSMALGALAALHDAGLRVPADVSLVGYDNTPVGSSQLLRLTTVEDHSREVGRRAALTAQASLARRSPGHAGSDVAATAESAGPSGDRPAVLPELVLRGSSGPVARR